MPGCVGLGVIKSCVWWAGTKTSLTSKSLLPVPRRPGDVPGVMNGHLLGREVAEHRRLTRIATILYGSQSHEPRRMAAAASERPASGHAEAAGHGMSRTDRARCGDDEGAGVGKPLASNRVGKISGDPAHSTAVCHDPAIEPSSAEAASTTRMNSTGGNSGPPIALGNHRRNNRLRRAPETPHPEAVGPGRGSHGVARRAAQAPRSR